MPASSGDRSAHFPAIEKKHGGPISKWITALKKLGDARYPEQIAFLREKHGFSQTHANALVMYVRGSTTSKRFATPADYFKSLDPQARKTAKSIFDALMTKWPNLEHEIAWNQPMLRLGKTPVFGLSTAKNHLLLNFFSADVLETFSTKLSPFKVNKMTVQVPLDWKIDSALLQSLLRAKLAELT